MPPPRSRSCASNSFTVRADALMPPSRLVGSDRPSVRLITNHKRVDALACSCEVDHISPLTSDVVAARDSSDPLRAQEVGCFAGDQIAASERRQNEIAR